MAKDKRPYRTRSSSSTPKRALDFTPVSLVPSLSPQPATDRVLTFLQSARDRNVPVRFGKWSEEEDLYLTKLIAVFQDGNLANMESKTTLRTFLSLMLNCCPMRISKKQMHTHSFSGKTKYQRKPCKMTQQEYEELSQEIFTLREEFLKAWAKEEYARRGHKQEDESFQLWYDTIVQVVPTPRFIRKASWPECMKRPIESLDELKLQVQDDRKKQRVQMLVEIKPQQQQQQQQQLQLQQLPVAAIPEPATVSDTVVTPLPTSYCSEQMNVGDWLARHHCNDLSGEARYTFCEDEVQVSVHLADQNSLSMTRRSSRLVIDFGAPSCWYTGEEPKRSLDSDYSQWIDNDLTEELALVMEPGLFGWDDAVTTYSPSLNFM
ncbi:hypothetical protein PHMEG_00018901 [Phytophthora megakarya]|uniref:Uncharacterized protein n=1 Tax=Phytophthora megakarya TaxID=4795 RepID=A0A225VVH8_9STRA|nr:hypothetical protein PHMEG_00018901 [Phytophthora megakarya]